MCYICTAFLSNDGVAFVVLLPLHSRFNTANHKKKLVLDRLTMLWKFKIPGGNETRVRVQRFIKWSSLDNNQREGLVTHGVHLLSIRHG